MIVFCYRVDHEFFTKSTEREDGRKKILLFDGLIFDGRWLLGVRFCVYECKGDGNNIPVPKLKINKCDPRYHRVLSSRHRILSIHTLIHIKDKEGMLRINWTIITIQTISA